MIVRCALSVVLFILCACYPTFVMGQGDDPFGVVGRSSSAATRKAVTAAVKGNATPQGAGAATSEPAESPRLTRLKTLPYDRRPSAILRAWSEPADKPDDKPAGEPGQPAVALPDDDDGDDENAEDFENIQFEKCAER